MNNKPPQDTGDDGKPQPSAPASRQLSPGAWSVIVAIIGLIGTVITVLASRPAPVAKTDESQTRITPAVVTAPSGLTLSIEGPDKVPLGKKTYFHIATTAVGARLTWTIDGYGFDKDNVVDNVAPRHEIWVEPTDATRLGETFTIQATVSDNAGQSETATRKFVLIKE